MENKTKTCPICKIRKEKSEFRKNDGYCSPCRTVYDRERRKKNRKRENERAKEWRNKNPEKWAAIQKRVHLKKLAENPNYHKDLYQHLIKTYPGIYKNDKRSAYFRNRTKNDLWYKTRQILAARLHCAIKDQGGIKAHKTMILVGCDAKSLISYIEKQFTPEMNWENQGSYWELDHVVPCRFFNLTNELCQRVCFFYLNLRPLEKYENKSKSNKMLHPEHLLVILNHLNISIDEFEAANSAERREAEAV